MPEEHSAILRYELYKQQEKVEETKAGERARTVARAMIADMATGEATYDHEVFLFAATAGQPEKYQPEAKLLKQASGIRPGDIVGIRRGDKMPWLGQVSNEPFIMEVDVDKEDPTDRQLIASINFGVAYNDQSDSLYLGADNIELGKIEVPILVSHREPSPTLRDAFSTNYSGSTAASGLVIGSGNVFRHMLAVEAGEENAIDKELRYEKFQMLLGHLASQNAEQMKSQPA